MFACHDQEYWDAELKKNGDDSVVVPFETTFRSLIEWFVVNERLSPSQVAGLKKQLEATNKLPLTLIKSDYKMLSRKIRQHRKTLPIFKDGKITWDFFGIGTDIGNDEEWKGHYLFTGSKDHKTPSEDQLAQIFTVGFEAQMKYSFV